MAYIIYDISFWWIITTVLVLKNKNQSTKDKAINLVINLVFGLYILDFFLMPLAYGSIDIEKLPFHICTVSCVLCFLSRHNKFFEKYKLQFVLLGLIGNINFSLWWWKIRMEELLERANSNSINDIMGSIR